MALMDTHFKRRFSLESTVNQLHPQKINSNVWIGPLNTVTQRQFLKQNNIKCMIGIMPTQKCCWYLKDYPQDEFCCVSIDPNFSTHKLTEDEGQDIMNFNTRFSPNVNFISEGRISTAIVTNIDYQKLFDDFLFLMNEIQKKDPHCGILLFSLNGNDNLLTAFTSIYIQYSMDTDVLQSLKFLKITRPTIWDFDGSGVLINKLFRFHVTLKARKQYNIPSVKPKRSACDISDFRCAELERPRNRKRLM